MTISVDDIKKLRDTTGAGMMDAKNALEEASGDMQKAQEILRVKGVARAEKKSDREASAGVVEAYIHGGKIGVLVEINSETDFVARTDGFKAFAHDVAMHIAAANPLYLDRESVPAEVVDKEKQLIIDELTVSGKPAEYLDKIVEGKLSKFYAEVCLMDQPFVKDPDSTIEQLRTNLVAKLGENIVIRRFSRMELAGE
jgi:elongation factor Ts